MPFNHSKTELMQNPRFRNRGLTLLEIVLAILILSIVSVGCLGYQYFATRMAVRANAEMTVTRTARLILDNWKKAGGNETFAPTSLDVGFEKKGTGSQAQYQITTNQIPMTVELDWNDVDQDTIAAVTLRQIQVTVRWRSDYQDSELRSTDPSYVMTTYVRIDEAGG
jgi:prepilin-type N-terminal cleavage/methylation domain-containing protein